MDVVSDRGSTPLASTKKISRLIKDDLFFSSQASLRGLVISSLPKGNDIIQTSFGFRREQSSRFHKTHKNMKFTQSGRNKSKIHDKKLFSSLDNINK